MIKNREISRFHPKLQPLAEQMDINKPTGTIVEKFHGEPVYVPAIERGEPMVGKSHFSQRQFEKLIALEEHRRQTIVHEMN